jgi:hypothetical protein
MALQIYTHDTLLSKFIPILINEHAMILGPLYNNGAEMMQVTLL